MNKKYKKPELKTHKIELGVFGDYGSGGEGNGDINPSPVKIISDLIYHME